jgi:hypothetical protein
VSLLCSTFHVSRFTFHSALFFSLSSALSVVAIRFLILLERFVTFLSMEIKGDQYFHGKETTCSANTWQGAAQIPWAEFFPTKN